MQVVWDLPNPGDPARRSTAGSALTIGAFDGVHLGHRAVFRRLREEAAPRGLRAALVTFDRHPAEIVRPTSAPCRLTDLDHKLELLEGCGLLDLVAVLTFDQNRRGESAEAFVEEVLVAALEARLVVVGSDFHFGHQRKGDVSLLVEMGEELGFEVIGLDLLRPGTGGGAGPSPVSSTLVRSLIAEGKVGEAALLLGRSHELRGTVVSGLRRGRELGFPTANVAVPGGACVPREGVYAGTLRATDGVERAAAISLGTRPTFADAGPELVLEAHVVGFDGDLYGQRARVGFLEWLHPQERFRSVEALVVQMHEDVEAAMLTFRPAAAGRGGS